MKFFNSYKERYHLSVNFYSFFLLVTFIPDILGITPEVVVYPFWALKAALAFWVILKYRKKIYHLDFGEQLFLFVAFVYLANMVIDIFMQNYPIGMGSVRDLVGFCLSILIAFSFRSDSAFYSNKGFVVFVGTLSVGLIIAFFMARESPAPLVNRFDANSTVNTINYGQMGCALCLMAVFGFFKKRFKWSYPLFVALFCLGALSIMKAGSRSPIVVLMLVSVLYTFSRQGFLKGLAISFFLVFMVWLSLDLLVEVGESIDSGLAERVISAVEKKETSGRDEIYANTWNIITKSPLFGDFYLIPSGMAKGYYPHNFFLEAFMTTGLLGGIPFVIMVVISLIKSYRLLKTEHDSSWLVLLFLQLLVYGMFSSALYTSQDFWALCLFILSISPLEGAMIKNRDPSRFESRLV